MDYIPDHLDKNLLILFIGFNPSIRSGEEGHHYANPANRFWKILHDSGLTSRRYLPEEDASLLDLGYGFTNIVSRPTVGAADITKEEYMIGRQQLKEKIELFKPKYACFVGKGVYQEYSRKKKVDWGFQHQSIVPGTIDFVAPSSSGLVRMKVAEVTDIYRKLADALKLK